MVGMQSVSAFSSNLEDRDGEVGWGELESRGVKWGRARFGDFEYEKT